MTTPATGDVSPAAKALQQSEDIAKLLEALVPAEPAVPAESTAATKPTGRPDSTKTDPIPRPERELEGDELLYVIQSQLDTAITANDKDTVRRLIGEGKAALVQELMVREKGLAHAKEMYDKAVSEFKATAPVTVEAEKELKKWQESYAAYEAFVPEQEAYYDGLVADVAAPHEAQEVSDAYSLAELRTKTREELLVIFDTAVEKYKALIQEIEAEKAKLAPRTPDETQQKINAIKARIT